MHQSQWFYQIDGFSIHPDSRQVIGTQTFNVRPKTFSLLLLLLDNKNQVLTKDFILQRIWDDVKVEEQVLVQSIRELRQIFSPVDVIQTHPRKGYAWVAPVSKIESDATTRDILHHHPAKKNLILPAVALLSVLLITVLGFYNFYSSPQVKPKTKEIITILPINNRMEGANLAWVRLGVMDQLIQSLKISPSLQVFDVSYVLRLLEIAKIDEQQKLPLINRIFEISGSSLVVDTELSGSINDYRLLYHLYTPAMHTSGILVDHQVDNLVIALAKIITEKSSAGLNAQKLTMEFNSGLLVEAAEKWKHGQYESAIALLEAVINLEPENFLAYQLFIEYKEKLRDWPGAVALANRVIPLAEQNHFARTHVFYYLLAESENAQGHDENTKAALNQAQAMAKEASDILYQAYVASLWGDMAVSSKRYEEAESYYHTALEFHQSIACPIGMAIVHSKFIELYDTKGSAELIAKHAAILKRLINKHHLTLDFSEMVKNSMGLIKE